jgi:hypothetical protein
MDDSLESYEARWCESLVKMVMILNWVVGFLKSINNQPVAIIPALKISHRTSF